VTRITASIESKREYDPVFTVKSLLGTKVDLDNKVRYLTWWEAFPKRESTWEPYSTFVSKEPVREYWANLGTSRAEGERQVKRKHREEKKVLREEDKQAKQLAREHKERLAMEDSRKRKASAPRQGSRKSKRVKQDF
jgi:hypothetical protein